MAKIKVDINQKRLEIIEWARLNAFVIDPFKGMDHHIDDFAETGWCPCDKAGIKSVRTNCPCKQSLADILENGRCLCGLFWTQKAVVARVEKNIKDKEEELEQKRTAADSPVH